MDYKRIEIKSLGIGLLDITNLDLTKDNFIKTYLAIGQKEKNNNSLLIQHNLIVTENAIGINTTRNEVINDNTNSLLVNGNIKCTGSIIADNIILDNPNLDILNNNMKNFNEMLNRISSHLLFYNVKNYLEDNIYTNFNVIIGNQELANNNKNALKIARYANNNYSNIQFAIENTDTTNNNEKTKICMGIIGNLSNSPAHIITSEGMPLHFNISKKTNDINDIYNDEYLPSYSSSNYPSLAIDTNNTVLINLDKLNYNFNYLNYNINNQDLTIVRSDNTRPSIYVNGVLYANTILINDYITNKPVNLDTLYVRKGPAGGLSINANQIYGRDFNKIEFKFNSNIIIGDNNNNYGLTIYGNIEKCTNINTTNIDTYNLYVHNNLIVDGYGRTSFRNDCYFSGISHFASINCDNDVAIKTLNITDKLLYKGNLIDLNLNSSILTTPQIIIDQIIDNSLLIGGQTTNITDPTYGSEIINIYKYKELQKGKFEIYLNNYGSKSYIGHNELSKLNNEIDDSLIIFTEYNTNWNNIYFYSGKKRNDLKYLIPNLAIMENDKIGINTNKPEKTLDINGDIISSNYYIRNNNNIYKCILPFIYNNNSNNLNNLNINFNENDFNLINSNDLKQFNVKGGINSFNGYFENNREITTIKKIDNDNSIIENNNLGLNIQLTNSKITMPFQIRNNNTNNNKINNSVITFYKSKDNSRYSGIEFCDDATNNLTVHNNKWYIYKNHVTDDIGFVGPLNIGYMKNSYKPVKSCINIYYSKTDKYFIDINSPYNYKTDNDYINNKETVRLNGSVKIIGDLDVDGSINITGNYKFNDNNILFSPNPVQTIINKIYSLGNNIYYFDTVLSSNYPKKISFNNKIISSDIYSNIIFDTNPNTNNIDIINSSNNLIVSYSNYLTVLNNNNSFQNLTNNFNLASNISNIVIRSYSKLNPITKNSIDNYLLSSNLLYNYSTSITNFLTISSNYYNNSLNVYNRVSLSKNAYLTTANSLNTNISNIQSFNITNSNTIQNYNNQINSIYLNSNIFNKYSTNVSNLRISTGNSFNDNYVLYQNNYITNNTNELLYNISNVIYTNTSNINLNSSNLNIITSDIYKTLSNINLTINNYYLLSLTNSNNFYLSNQLYLNSNSIIANNYSNLINIIDIKNIISIANSNSIISTNIYNISSNFNNSIKNLNNNINICSNLSYNDYIITLNLSNTNSYYNSLNYNKNQLSNLLYYNFINSSNNYNITSNIYNNIIDNYSVFYNNLIATSNIYYKNNDYNINKILNSTSRIVNSINSNLNSYLISSSNAYLISSNIDNKISIYDIDSSEKLSYYETNQDIGIGIGKIISFINNEINLFTTYKNNLELLEINYSFISIYDIYYKLLIQINFCINLLREIRADINNINDIYLNTDLSILLQLVLHITNKYINFINNSYLLCSIITNLAEVINNDISTFTTTSLSELPLLLLIINYANSFLNECWDNISMKIIDYASLSYSLNSKIGSMPSTNIINNNQGQNTDVMIIGNNIKYYPNNSIYIGHENEYSRWLENTVSIDTNINDNYKSLLYLYNYNANSVSCSFNSRSQKFISMPGVLSLKSSSAIDINLVDTTQKSYQSSLIDGVSLRLSHIFKRYDYNTIEANENKSLFEIVRKTNDEKPYLSCYTTNDGNNIINIGDKVNFYNPDNYECIDENVIMHINQNTNKYLLKLTNISENPLLVGFNNNNLNKWDFKINNDFGFNYNNLNILNITSNGLSINSIDTNNSSMLINSFNNTTALKIKNNYLSSTETPNQRTEYININNSFNINYNSDGIIYTKKDNFLTDYEALYTKFIIDKNINITSNITGTLNNVKMNFNNISDTKPFTFSIIDNSNIVNLMPIIDNTNINLIIENNYYTYNTFQVAVPATSATFIIYYKMPSDAINYYSTISSINNNIITINTKIENQYAIDLIDDYATITINYQINYNSTTYYFINNIKYYKYLNFNVPSINITLSNYSYKLLRTNNQVPKNLYNNNYQITSTSNLTNGNQILINNNLNYLNNSANNLTNLNNNLYTEQKLINYPISIFNINYYFPINFFINDSYQTISILNNNINIDFINYSIKKPSICQMNIYNNSHNIYSYSDNYEIYFNQDKLLNIDPSGTLTTTGNIQTNNIYLKGDIYNSEGKSLFDNIISIFNNKNLNFELNTQQNIILNPSNNGNRNENKSGIYINGNGINSKYNNLFQINNFIDNDNLLTLNSITQNSFIHFITNSITSQQQSTNCIYRMGTLSDSFGIWKRNDNISPYNNNYFIDTSTTDGIFNYTNAILLTKRNNTNDFLLEIYGAYASVSDKRLKKNIKRIDNALDKICKLEGITYKMIDNNNDECDNDNTGLIAQDVNEVLPQVVHKNDNGFYSITYANMMGLVVEAIKELRQEINELKKNK